jgi:pimeloyl-ACP methyl ester carboxylesterase
MLAMAYAAAHPDRIDRHSLLKSSTLIYLDKCGHFPWLEQPEAFRQAIGSFMAGSGPK